jgi:hypothetical protein
MSSPKVYEILPGRARFCMDSFIWVMFIVEFPVAAYYNGSKNVPAILINWLNVKTIIE